MPPSRAPGRPPKYVRDRDRKPIVGLSVNATSGRYYATHSRPRVYLGTGYDTAIAKFRAWASGHKKKIVLPELRTLLQQGVNIDECVAEGWSS
jgi:hypothetical protein